MTAPHTFPKWLFQPTWPLDRQTAAAARVYQGQLTKPAGSLGQLEVIAELFAAWQGRVDPQLDRIAIRIFAADHGVCAKGVSAFPQAVTGQMITNFLRGGAAISVLARQLGANLAVHNLGTIQPVPVVAGLRDCTIAPGTRDFTEEVAMTKAQLADALAVGAVAVPGDPLHLFIGGEMGIGNTTSSSALISVLLDLPSEIAVGPGTGLDATGLQRKQQVVAQAVTLHRAGIVRSGCPALAALMCLGGLEIAALVGAYIRCAQRGIGVVVDGFISTTAALCAVMINPGVRDWLLFGHVSAEPAHRIVLEHLRAKPLLDLQMRLGEASGAAMAVPLLRAALALHNQMATFAAAGVAEA